LLLASATPMGRACRPVGGFVLTRTLEERTHRAVYWLSRRLVGAPGPVTDVWARARVLPAEDGPAHQLLHDRQQLGLVFDEALPWAVETALRAGVAVVPVVVTPRHVQVRPAVHFDALANQRRYDPAVVAEYAERVATDLGAVHDQLDVEPVG
jgi:hypothetical protein